MKAPIEISKDDVKMWARAGEGSERGELWASVLRSVNRMNGPVEILWHSSSSKRDHRCAGHGLVEVKARHRRSRKRVAL